MSLDDLAQPRVHALVRVGRVDQPLEFGWLKYHLWLNLIECAFSNMARTFLRHGRVKAGDELKERILEGIAEFHVTPVVFRWTKFGLGVA